MDHQCFFSHFDAMDGTEFEGVLRNEQAPEMVAELMEFGLFESRADALAALRSMHGHSTTSGAVRLADFLAVMDSLCSGEGGAAFHTRLRGALRRWCEMREELQLAAAAGSPASSDGTMTGSEGEEEEDPFTEWSMLEPFATGDLREVVRRHSGGDAAGWRSTDSEGEGDESESESHERRLVLRHLARMLGDREHGPAVRHGTLPVQAAMRRRDFADLLRCSACPARRSSFIAGSSNAERCCGRARPRNRTPNLTRTRRPLPSSAEYGCASVH